MTSGRKQEFDTEVALDAAMHVFWQKGYVGTSLADLTESMGINKPSLYRTFGNKESLFIKTTQRYLETQLQPHVKCLFDEVYSLKQRIKAHIMSVIGMQCNTQHPMGCYLVLCQSELASNNIPDDAKQILSESETMPKELYTELFENDPESIKLGLNKHASENSLTLYTLLKGTASMARSGVTQNELEYTVDSTLNGIGIQ